MAYDKDFPADDSYLADFPSGEREQIRAIVEDKIVNAGKLQGLAPSNASGQVPVSNGTVCTGLNADKLDGYDASHFSADGHVHNNASTSTAGFMSAADKTKLDGVATGAEVNQNAFGNVAVGTSTLQADNKQDTLYLAAGSNVSIAADETNDKITIGLTGTVPVENGGTGNNSVDTTPTANSTKMVTSGGVKSALDTKLPLSGGTMTGQLAFQGIGNTGKSQGLYWGGSTDWASIYYQTTESDQENLVINLADDDNCYLRIAYNGDFKSYFSPADGAFHGKVIGNADTATKFATARTLSLSGTGLSATAQSFDGSGNVTIPITLANALLAIAGITPSAGKLPVFTGANTATLATITDFAKTLLSKGSADDVRSAIGAINASGAGVVAGNVSNARAWWVKLGGTIPLIIQGGIKSYSTNTFTFPVSFPHAILGVSVVLQRNTESANQTINVYNISNTQMNTVEYNLEAYCLMVGW